MMSYVELKKITAKGFYPKIDKKNLELTWRKDPIIQGMADQIDHLGYSIYKYHFETREDFENALGHIGK